MRKVVAAAVPLILLLVMAGLRVADLRAAREEVLRTAGRRAANLAAITAAYLDESFGSADAVLRQLALHSRRVGGPSAPAAEWSPALTAARAGIAVGALTITDDAGLIRHSTRPEIVGQSRRDELGFRDALRAGPDALVVGPPFPTVDSTPASPRYIIPITRALTDAEGRVLGTATASFLPAVAQAFLQSVDVGAGGGLWVFHPDGILLFQEPAAERAAAPGGESAAPPHPIVAAARPQGSGVVRGAIDAGGAARITGFQTMEDPPLIVAVSLDERAVLAAWRTEATRSGVLFGVVAAMLVAVVVVLVREMAARSAALAREQRARLDAEEASAVKDQFLMTLSHELRTPLTAVRGWTRMLALGTLDAQQRRAVEVIERNAHAQERLIGDLLDMSRVISGKLPLTVQIFAIVDVAQRALDSVRPGAEAKGLQLQSALDPGAGLVSGDPERLEQALWNLLANAVKFTPAGGRVRMEVRRTGDHAQIEVSDTGIGIAPSFRPHVFERFRQEDASTTREYGGLGLGLAIARSLVEMHGGSVEAHSEGTGRGATFIVRVPLAPAGAAPSHPSAHRASSGAAQ